MSTPASIPNREQLIEWVQFAQESLELGRYKDALRDLSQVLRIARGEGEAKPKPYTPPPDGTAAPLVDEVVAKRKEKRISQDEFWVSLKAIAQRCGFQIFKRLNAGQLRDDWYATRADNIGLEVESGYKDYDLVEWLKKQNLQE
ncbi:hypothetical protein WA1_51560 [Scytonema hofmannii PCC 7110]|uniref:Uncharacterized protein n=1 Tax=Scytonema hofmannii PCC 7110 TaxID=128403 RepID=A0A139WPX8_9CYAN|nr:hypothetical protein [Scytonema hofmannii]KYC34483.1 hypothetical protein WA1_51560 [Scytonema hofmannii PCC 7110]